MLEPIFAVIDTKSAISIILDDVLFSFDEEVM
jgi:hypothetical protein